MVTSLIIFVLINVVFIQFINKYEVVTLPGLTATLLSISVTINVRGLRFYGPFPNMKQNNHLHLSTQAKDYQCA